MNVEKEIVSITAYLYDIIFEEDFPHLLQIHLRKWILRFAQYDDFANFIVVVN